MKRRWLRCVTGMIFGVCLTAASMMGCISQMCGIAQTVLAETEEDEGDIAELSASSGAVKLDADKVGEITTYNNIIYNADRNGLYLIHTIGTVYSNAKQYEIVFYDIDEQTYETVYTSDSSVEKAYMDDTGAFFLHFDTFTTTVGENKIFNFTPVVERFLFSSGQASELTLDEITSNTNWGNYAMALGVDQKGRIYIATDDNELHLFDSTGKHLSKASFQHELMENSYGGYSWVGGIYGFYGFDPVNGNFYYNGAANWYYWGFSHGMTSLMAGKVNDDNSISVQGGNMMYLYQSGFYNHVSPVRMLNGKYLAALSTFSGNQAVLLDSNAYDISDVTESSTTINMSDSSVSVSTVNISNKKAVKLSCVTAGASSDDYVNDIDTTSIGTRCALNDDATSLLVKTDEQTLTEYKISTQKERIRLNTAHPIYTFFFSDQTCYVVEKEGKAFYLEQFDWTYPTTFSVDAPKTMKVGESDRISCTVKGGFDIDYTYKSSDSSVVSVDKNGKINAWKKGTAIITVKSATIGVTKTVTIQVKNSTLSKSSTVYRSTSVTGTVSATMHDSTNSGSTYGSVQTAYLNERADGTFERVEYIRGKVVRELYDSSYRLKSKKTIKCELPIFGGYYCGGKYNYLVFGQSNPKESKTKEVIRVVKYDKNWKRIGVCKIKGANTYVPFDAGGLDMTEAKGKLYIHTCHEMFQTSDGYHHQANCTFVVKESNMKLVDAYYDVMNLSYGYVSHSFAQQIETDGTYIYRADLGDAYPRGITLTATKTSDLMSSPTRYGTLISISGSTGDNYTGFTLNDLKLGADNYILTGTGIKSETTSVRNVYINAGSKTSFTGGATWITNYKAKDHVTVMNPKLVALSDSQFLLMWEEKNTKKNTYKTKLLLLDEAGNKASSVYSTTLALSMCEPVVTKKGKVVWYVTNNSTPVFVEVNPYQLSKVQTKTKTATTFKKDQTAYFDNSQKSGYRKGDVVIKNKMIYQITSGSTVTFGGVTGNSIKTLSIPSTVKLGKKTYKVTAVAARACINRTKLQKVVIGSNVKKIGKYAFYGCKKLTSVRIKTTLLKSKTIGKKAFQGIAKRAVIKVPKAKKTAYKKILLKRGVTKKMKIKR